MTRAKGTFLAVIAVLLSPMAANADIIEINVTLDVSFLSSEIGFVNNSSLPFGENAIISDGDVVNVFVDFSGTQTVTATDMVLFLSYMVIAPSFSSTFSILDAFTEFVGASSQPATTSNTSGGGRTHRDHK